MSDLGTLVASAFLLYLAVAGALVIFKRRTAPELLAPLFALLLVVSLVPSLIAALVQGFFSLVSPWWIVAGLLLVLTGIALRP